MSAAQFDPLGFRAAFTGTSFRAESWWDPDLEHAPAASTGDIAGSADLVFGAGSSTLAGAGALAGSADLVFGAGSTNLVGLAPIAATSALVFGAGSSTLVGTGALATSTPLVFGAGSSTLTGAGALDTSTPLVFGAGSSTLTGAGALAGSSALVFSATLATDTGSISGSADLLFGSGASALTGQGALAGDAALVFGAQGAAIDIATPVVATEERPAGRSKSRRYRDIYRIKVDGEAFEFTTYAAAVEFLDRAKKAAAELADRTLLEAIESRESVEIPLPTFKEPEIVASSRDLRSVVTETKKEIADIYKRARRDAEIAMLLEVVSRDQYNEEIIWFM